MKFLPWRRLRLYAGSSYPNPPPSFEQNPPYRGLSKRRCKTVEVAVVLHFANGFLRLRSKNFIRRNHSKVDPKFSQIALFAPC